MRRFTALLFLTVYFNVAWGSAFNLYFCCGHVSDISFAHFNSDDGDGLKMKNAGADCCSEKSLQAKTDNHKTNPNIALIEDPPPHALQAFLPEVKNKLFNDLHSNIFLRLHNFRQHFPQSIFLIYCNLRI